VLAFTDRAREVLRRSHEAARRFNPDAVIRITLGADGEARFDLVDRPAEGDAVLEEDGFVLSVAPGVRGTVDVALPHDRLVLRPGP
jgi:Fe-S cluster assembly iron-binding protein IscA